MNDLFTLKQQTSSDQEQVTTMQDTISRIYNFACSQVNQVSGPGIASLITTLQQIPKSINYQEKLFGWIENFSSEMSPLMVKNPQFSDAVTHF